MQIIIVGGGITGVAAALELRREGHETVLIDRVKPGDTGQTSFGNAGVLASKAIIPISTPGFLSHVPKMWFGKDGPVFFNPLHLAGFLPWLRRFSGYATEEAVARIAEGLTPVIGDSLEMHRALSAGTDAADLIDTGPYVYLYRDQAAFEADLWGWEFRRERGQSWEEWDRDDILDRDPFVSEDYAFAAALSEQGWVRLPGAYIKALFDAYMELDGIFRLGEVVDLTPDPATVTLAGGEEMAADKVILTTGAWSDRLMKKLGHRSMVTSERGYHITFENPEVDGEPVEGPGPYMLTDAKVVVTPMEPGLRLAGLAEFAPVDAPEKQGAYDLIRRLARKLYPGITWEEETQWMGRRPSTPDSLPLIGASPKAPDFVCAFGGQHLGLTMGPKIARLAAQVATGRAPNIDMAPYAVDRFDP